jgi:TolB protein
MALVKTARGMLAVAAASLTAGLITACGGSSSSHPMGPRHSGGLIVFESNFEGPFRIYAIKPEGEIRAVTDGPDDSSPAWSPDGRRIVFVRTGTVSSGVAPRTFFIVNANGSGLRRLTTSRAVDDFPAWSPDEHAVAFTRYLGKDKYDVYAIDSDGSGKRKLASAGVGGPPNADLAWAPDGHKLAFVRNRGTSVCGIYVINTDGSGLRRIASGHSPAWSPDGREIAFARSCGETWGSGLYKMNADGTRPRRLAFGLDPVWSPDGRRIAFSRLLRGSQAPDIYVMERDGSNQRRLTHNDRTEASITWSPGGEEIAFAQTECCGTFPAWEIHVVRADGTDDRATDLSTLSYGPSWQPRGRRARHAGGG